MVFGEEEEEAPLIAFREAMAGVQALKRIPSIKFPQRYPKPTGADIQPQSSTVAEKVQDSFVFKTDVPAPPKNIAVGGKASLQPKRSPLSEREIEAILLGGVE